MKMKKFITAMAVTAVSAISMTAMTISAYAAEINLAYTKSDNALTTSDDTNEIRVNICNTWSGNNIKDIDTDTPVSEKIVVNFTVDGIGTKNENSSSENLCAYLIGSIGTNSAWNADESGNETVSINGDGDYTVTWTLEEDSETIDNLILQTNIKPDDGKTLKESGINISINYISTIGDESSVTTTTTTTETTTTATSTTTTTTSAVISSTPANTGDAGIGSAVAGLALAGATIAISKKKKK